MSWGTQNSSLRTGGAAGPKGIPPAIAQKLADAFEKGMKDPSFKELMDTMNMIVVYRGPKEFEEMAMRDYDIHGDMIKEIEPLIKGIK